MGEIYISPCNHLPLDEMLLVPLVFVDRSEKTGVEPRLSASLRLTVLRRLSRALAQCLRRTPSSPRRHETLQRATPMWKQGQWNLLWRALEEKRTRLWRAMKEHHCQTSRPRSEMWSRAPQNSLRRLATAGIASKMGLWQLNRRTPSTTRGKHWRNYARNEFLNVTPADRIWTGWLSNMFHGILHFFRNNFWKYKIFKLIPFIKSLYFLHKKILFLKIEITKYKVF